MLGNRSFGFEDWLVIIDLVTKNFAIFDEGMEMSITISLMRWKW